MDNNAIMIKTFTPLVCICTILASVLLIACMIQQSKQGCRPTIVSAVGFILSIYVFSIGIAWILILLLDKNTGG